MNRKALHEGTAKYTFSHQKRNEIMKELHTPQIKEFTDKYRRELERACWKDKCRQDLPQKDFEVLTKRGNEG
jgi:hypothetical protein